MPLVQPSGARNFRTRIHDRGFELGVVAALVTFAAPAFGYSTSSAVSDGCHERITMDALRRVRSELPGAAVVTPNESERALIDDMPCELEADMRDFGAVSMLLGNRDVDLHGNAPNDLTELAPLHGDPNRQDEHCLRAAGDDEPDGSRIALARCRDGVRARVESGLTGLDRTGIPDPAQRSAIKVVLDLRGSVDAALPVYQVELGRALHVLQDGFSHAYRTPGDQRLVTQVLNYVDVAEKRFDERVDGPPHNSGLDRCVDLDAFRAERLELATRASYELIRVTLEPNSDLASKQANVEEVLSRYLSLDPNARCSFDNGWCDAPEKSYPEERGCVCSHVAGIDTPPLTCGVFGAFALFIYLRRRAGRPSPGGRAGMVAAIWLTAVFISKSARADEPPTHDAVRIEAKPVVARPEPSRFGVVVAGGGALQNGALAASLGGVVRLNASLLVGAEAEYNPWYAVRSFELRSGSTNVYASGVLRFPLRFQRVNLRSTLHLGISRMNFALYGVPEGSVGPYVGFNLLGIDYEIARRTLLIINPAHIAIPIPKTSTVPFAYPQYRVTIGAQFGG